MSAGSPAAVGVDLGTTYTCAAVADPGGAPRVVQLSGTSQTIPSVVSITDEAVLAGEAAERRLVTHPSDTAREFKRRLGDATPIVLAGEGYPAEVLTGHLLREVLDRVEQNEGGRPSIVGLSHPAAWGPFRLDLLRDAARHAGVDDPVLVPEPVAAAVANRERVEAGSLVAVYDLGGGTFDAAVVRIGDGPDGVDVVGTPEGVERLGGIDFDQAVMAHVDSVLGGQVFGADRSDPETRQALMRLRAECQAAKEHLSQDSDVDIAVALPGLSTTVRMTRAEFEAAVQPRLADSLAVFDRVAGSAGSGWGDISSILLVGGSSNVPLVAQLVGEHTGRPVITATRPHLAIAAGAAAVAAASATPPAAATAVSAVAAAATAAAPAIGSPSAEATPGTTGRSKLPLFAGAIVALVAIVAAIVLVTSGGDDDTETATATDTATETTVAETAAPDATTAPDETTPDDTDDTGQATTVPDGSGPVPVEVTLANCIEVSADTVAVLGTDTGALIVGPDQVRLVDGLGPSNCGVDPSGGTTFDVPAAGTPTHAAAFGPLFAIATDQSGAIGAADGAARECALISGPIAMNDSGAVFPIDENGAVGRVRTTGGDCSAGDSSPSAGIEATAVGVGSSSRIAIGGTGDDGLVVRVFNGADNSVDVPAEAFGGALGSIDAITPCGDRWCIIDLDGSYVHVVDGEGSVLGAATLADTPLADAAEILSTTPSSGGPSLVTARLGDGTVIAVSLA